MPVLMPMRQKQTNKLTPELIDFGFWVKARLANANVTIADLARGTGITYPSLNNMLNSGSRGKPTRQDGDTVITIAKALRALGVIEDDREAYVAAGFLAAGYKVVKEGEAIPTGEMTEDEYVRFYEGSPPDVQRRLTMRTLFREQDQEDNEGTIGGTRAE